MTEEAVTDEVYSSARLKTNEDGSLSNAKAEQYAILIAEGVVSDNAAWNIIFKTPKSRGHRTNINRSAAFKRRVQFLMDQKAELQAQGEWGQHQWRFEQLYRKGAALNDTNLMLEAAKQLLKITTRNDPPPRPPAAPGRGPGAPAVETEPDRLETEPGENHHMRALLEKK